jgi:hypothetical protein
MIRRLVRGQARDIRRICEDRLSDVVDCVIRAHVGSQGARDCNDFRYILVHWET